MSDEGDNPRPSGRGAVTNEWLDSYSRLSAQLKGTEEVVRVYCDDEGIVFEKMAMADLLQQHEEDSA